MATRQKVVVEGSSVTASQMKEMWRQIADGSLAGEHFDAFLEHRNPFPPKSLPQSVSGLKASEQKLIFNLWLSRLPEFWQKFWGLKIDLSIFKIPKKLPAGFAWPVYIPAEFSHGDAVALCQKQFKVWEGIDIRTCGDAKGCDKPRLLIVRPTVEPDVEHLNKSANDLVTTGKSFLDIGARSVLEAQYFFMTSESHLDAIGSHLDVRGWTRCPNSRLSNGNVADACWYAGNAEFRLDWRNPDSQDSDAGGREVVYVPLKT